MCKVCMSIFLCLELPENKHVSFQCIIFSEQNASRACLFHKKNLYLSYGKAQKASRIS